MTISPKKPKPEPLPIEELVKRARYGTTDISDSNQQTAPDKMFLTPPERLDGLKGAYQDIETPTLRADELPQGAPEDQKECLTTYFIGFPKATLTVEARDDQMALQKHVKVLWANATTVVESTVDAAKKKGLLDEKDLIKVASYRAKCLTTMFEIELHGLRLARNTPKRRISN